MKTLPVLMLVIAGLLGGCRNAIYFYETEKFSMTIESRPDPTQPVSGNLGVKQRVVAVVPSGDEEVEQALQHEIRQSKTPMSAKVVEDRRQVLKSDALSLVSYFDLRKGKEGGRTTIETVLLTGDSIDELTADQLAGTAAALAAVSVPEVPPLEAIQRLTLLRAAYEADPEPYDNLVTNDKITGFRNAATFGDILNALAKNNSRQQQVERIVQQAGLPLRPGQREPDNAGTP